MTRAEKELKRLKFEAEISTTGFGPSFSLDSGIVVGAEGYQSATDQGSKGLVIPWMGSKHIKFVVGAD